MTHSPDPETAAAHGAAVLPGTPAGTARVPSPAAAPLADTDLAEEIELYTDVVVAASESDGPMPEGELDRVLGVEGVPPEG